MAEVRLIRQMLPDDLDQVMVVETRCYAFPWTHGIFSDCLEADYECWVLEHPKVGHLAGHAVLNVAAGESHLLNICVLREHQGEGLGRLLLNHVVSRAIEREAERVFLEVRPTNRGAIALYRSAGFEEIGIRKNYYPSSRGHEDAQVMALSLPKAGVST